MAGCGHPALRTRPKVRRRGGLYGRPRLSKNLAEDVCDAHIGPLGNDIQDSPLTAPTVGARMARPYPVPATTGTPDIPYLVPGGYKIRPYNMDGGQCVRRTASDAGAGGAMWASAPTQSARALAWKFDNPHSGAKRRFRHTDRGCLFVRQPLWMERDTGVEPACAAWEAAILPMN